MIAPKRPKSDRVATSDGPEAGRRIEVGSRTVTPDYFRAMGISLAAGRYLEPVDATHAGGVVVNQAFENMGLRTTQLLGTFFDGIARHTEEAYQWVEDFSKVGFRETIRRRDAPFGDYGERPAD